MEWRIEDSACGCVFVWEGGSQSTLYFAKISQIPYEIKENLVCRFGGLPHTFSTELDNQYLDINEGVSISVNA